MDRGNRLTRDTDTLVHAQRGRELLIGRNIPKIGLQAIKSLFVGVASSLASYVYSTIHMYTCSYRSQTTLQMSVYLGDEVVVQEYVRRSGQHGVVGGVLGLGLEEGVRRESWN